MSASHNSFHPSISLPNEGPAEPDPGLPAPVAVAAPRRFTPLRLILLTGGIALAGGSVFVLPQLVANKSIEFPSIRLPVPVRPWQAAPAPAPAPETPAAPPVAKPVPLSFMDDIAGLGAAAPAPPPAPAPAVAPIAAVPATMQSKPSPAVAPTAFPAEQADPAATILQLVPAPNSTTQEVSLLGLVTAIAAELRTSREDNAALRDQVKAISTNFDSRLEDLERRVRFREASEAVVGMRAPLPFADLGPPPAAPRSVVTVTAQVDAWRVQGGSPRMAVLAPTGGGPIKIVRVGDLVDDRLGKVERIYQDGRLWVVKAEHGSVRGGE